MLEADYLIRKTIWTMFPKSGVVDIVIERKSLEHSKVIVKTSKPGVLIGREGQKLKQLQAEINKTLEPLFKRAKMSKPALDFDILEVRKQNLCAQILAQQAAFEIEKRQSVRRVMKRLIERARQQRENLGIRVQISGRLNGSEIHRTEVLSWGKMPLSTLRAKIEYATDRAKCTYGIVGIKVWLYQGEKIKNEENSE